MKKLSADKMIVELLKVAANNYVGMIRKNRANQSSYTEWKVMAELRELVVNKFGVMTYSQFNEVMKNMTEEEIQ